jgi:hypothetical protein
MTSVLGSDSDFGGYCGGGILHRGEKSKLVGIDGNATERFHNNLDNELHTFFSNSQLKIPLPPFSFILPRADEIEDALFVAIDAKAAAAFFLRVEFFLNSTNRKSTTKKTTNLFGSGTHPTTTKERKSNLKSVCLST